jgi:hypothetical protein
VYKWQVFLGGVASATILVAGAAAPALAQTSPLTTVAQTVTGSQVTGQACNLAGLPMAAQVNSAVAGVTGESCPASQQTNSQETNSQKNLAKKNLQETAEQTSNTASSSTMTSVLPGLSTVTGEIPGLSSMSSSLPDLTSLPGQSSQGSTLTPVTSNAATTPLVGADVSGTSNSQNSLGSDQGSSVIPGALNGITGALPVSSLTGGLPNLSSVTGALSSVTGSQG